MIKLITPKRAMILFSISFFFGCATDESNSSFYHDISQTIYSSSEENNFENLVLILNFKSDSVYLVLDQIDEIKLKVNNSDWADLKEQKFDNSGITYTMNQNIKETINKVPYLIVSGQTQNAPESYTAGAFADYMNNFIYLTPGDYVVEIAEVKFRNLLNDTITVKPRIYQYFQVLPDTKSLFLGEFDIQVNLTGSKK